MADFCKTCSWGGVWYDYCGFRDHIDKFQNCESGSWDWHTSQSFALAATNKEEERNLFQMVWGFDEIPAEPQVSWSVMICEGCSRSGSLICPTDDNGWCIDPNCNQHAEINRAKGWYEIGGDIKTLGEYRNKKWDEKENICSSTTPTTMATT